MKKVLRHAVEIEAPGHGPGTGCGNTKIGQISRGPDDGQAVIQPVGVRPP
jgi:hypothetical protein